MGCQDCCCNNKPNYEINNEIKPINGHEQSKYNPEREEIFNLTETDNLKLSEGSDNSKKNQEKRNKKKKIDKNLQYKDYPTKILQIINNIRKDPVAYANVIEDSIKNIIIQKKR